ncbi:MAG: NFACT RNA binding domain-containing protein [Treponema sp.]|nr:NFACT RNA binding domain-containing protein [Treponema sp.]
MSLNWKEINLILEELNLNGAQIQSAVQSAYDVIILRFHKKGETKQVLISLSSGACRINETFRAVPKSEKPLRFAQFLSSKIVNGWVTEICQLDDNRIVKIVVKRPDSVYRLYIRLWSNAANFIVTNDEGLILDTMRRQPKRGEITGGHYSPENIVKNEKVNPNNLKPVREYVPRTYEVRELPGEGSFNKKIDEYYSAHGGSLSLEVLREQAKRDCEGSLGRINAALERLREKEESFTNAGRFKNYGDFILSNIANIKPDTQWLEIEEEGTVKKIELESRVSPAVMAQKYYELYRKSKKALSEIQWEITEGEQELKDVTEKLERLLNETNPLILAKLLRSTKTNKAGTAQLSKKEKTRPGLSFKRGDWLIIVGRDARENDELLRRHVKGNDLWLHARDYHGSYVFIRHRTGKTVPLDILLDAGNLAIFYSKGRNNGAGDLFYTSVKYLRRAKDGPKGLVIPTQEKNLHVKLDDTRLRSLENCRC